MNHACNTICHSHENESQLDQFLKSQQQGLLKELDHLERKQSAPSFIFPALNELSLEDQYFSTSRKPQSSPAPFNHISTVLSCLKSLPCEDISELEDCPEFFDISQKMDQVVKDLRRQLKVMIPYFPELARLLSWRRSVYFLHMLWYIREKMNSQTGVAIFSSTRMAHYLAMCTRTEGRLRQYFVSKNVFTCVYDRPRHQLNISVNWEGLNAFLIELNPKLAISPHQNILTHLQESVVDGEHTPPLQEENLTPLTDEEEISIRWFSPYIYKDASMLTPQQALTAIEDLKVVSLVPIEHARHNFKYLLYGYHHPLSAYVDACSKSVMCILEMILRHHAHLIPCVRALTDCADYYYKGRDVKAPLYDTWNWREKITYRFTHRLCHLVGMDAYASMVGHMSLVEWNDEGDHPEFLIATRNGVMATILGAFFSNLMYRFKENFRFYIVPLEGPLPYPENIA